MEKCSNATKRRLRARLRFPPAHSCSPNSIPCSCLNACISAEGDVNARAPCVPSHVHHILFEVLKNALRATALRHAGVVDSLPPVRVRIAQVRRGTRGLCCT